MKFCAFAFLILFLYSSTARAGTGVFSADGQQVFIADGQLKILDLSKPDHVDKVTTPSMIGERISAVARAGDSILCLSQHHVASFNPKTRDWKKITDATGDVKFLNMSFDSKSGLLLITKYPGDYAFYDGSAINLLCMNLNDTSPTTVRGRGVGFVRGPVFDAEGRLFFSWLGDLWFGAIQMKDGNAWLVGRRVLGLATHQTSIAGTHGAGIYELAPAASNLYFHIKERGGTTYGSIMSISNPAALQAPIGDNPYARQIELLSSLKMIDAESALTPFLAASPDGTKIFFRSSKRYYLIENGKSRELPLKFE